MKRTEIRRKVGELLGYRVEEWLDTRGGKSYWMLVCLTPPFEGEISLPRPTQEEAWDYLPHFDEDMSEAWRVVEFIHKQEGRLLEDFAWQFQRADLWGHTAEEAALEICRLALSASGVEVGEVEEG